MFDPDDFSDRPYEGGLNQMGHVTLGAALVSPLMAFLPVWGAVLGAGGIALAWEVFQLRYRGAVRPDYIADVAYWLSGVWIWAGAIHSGAASAWAAYFPCILIGAFCIEAIRIKANDVA
jgi:hypothetical protein